MATLYRIVKTDPPSERDFMSKAALGLQAPDRLSARQRRDWEAISVYTTEARARERARLNPNLGMFVAELAMPESTMFEFELWGQDPLHYNLWAEPAPLRARAVRVNRA